MPFGVSETIANSWLNGLCNSTAWTEPAEFWCKLHTNDPGDGASSPAANTTRQQPTFSAASGGAITTSTDIIWAAVPNTEIYTHLSFWDASSGGTFIGSMALDTIYSITAGQTFTIAAGAMDLAFPVTAPNMAVATINSWLDGLCRSVAWTIPAAFWVKLHIGNPGTAGTSNPAVETDRIQGTFSTADNGLIRNSAVLTWPAVSNTETYSYVSFWDSNVAGNFLGSQALASTRTITAGKDFTILVEDITLAIAPIANIGAPLGDPL